MTPERAKELRALKGDTTGRAEDIDASAMALPECLDEIEGSWQAIDALCKERDRLRKALELLATAAEVVLESHLEDYNLVKPMAMLSSNTVAARNALK